MPRTVPATPAASGASKAERSSLRRLEARDALLEPPQDPLGEIPDAPVVGIGPQEEHRFVEAKQPSGVGKEHPVRRSQPPQSVRGARADAARLLEALEQRVDAARHGAHATRCKLRARRKA